MKILKSLVAIAAIALMPFAFISCEDEADESCEQQDMEDVLNCDGEKNVEVCCTEGEDCEYHYNGTTYPDTDAGRSDLSDALGCSYKSSEGYNEQKELIIELLIELRNKARAGI